jgi:hypothetical protein
LKTTYIFLCLIISINNFTYSQDSKRSFDTEIFPFVGLEFGKYSFADAGICISGMSDNSIHPLLLNLAAASEFKLNKEFIIGPKLSGGITFYYLTAGINLIDYTNFKSNNYVLRPEIGGEFRRFKLVYGYNTRLSNKETFGINSHQANITYTFRKNRFFFLKWPKYMKKTIH